MDTLDKYRPNYEEIEKYLSTSNDRFSLEARIDITSGEMLITDLGYTKGLKTFDAQMPVEYINNYCNKLCSQKSELTFTIQEVTNFGIKGLKDSFHEIHDLMIRTDLKTLQVSKLIGEIIKKHNLRNYKDIRGYIDELTKVSDLIDRVIRSPHLDLPSLYQGNEFVLFCNGIGDGDYPIIQNSEQYQIVFNFPLKEGRLDTARLKGKLLGEINVECGSYMVVGDSSKIGIKKDVEPWRPFRLKVPNGTYSVSYIENNQALSIHKVD
ncbi:Uncharacterised protein [uncultured archaeon]|nr:Uncharacterised protein [uncultured archaeon]